MLNDNLDIEMIKKYANATDEEIKEARKMALAGYPIEQIASQMHRAHKTIQNYLNPDLPTFITSLYRVL